MEEVIVVVVAEACSCLVLVDAAAVLLAAPAPAVEQSGCVQDAGGWIGNGDDLVDF
jgi:hypothetical protein